jgi:hypothetical protein
MNAMRLHETSADAVRPPAGRIEHHGVKTRAYPDATRLLGLLSSRHDVRSSRRAQRVGRVGLASVQSV